MPKLRYAKPPKKWKNNGLRGSFGICQIHDKWEEVMNLLIDDEFYSLCQWAYYDLFGEQLNG
jgi:hypothetical protein